MYTHPIVCTDYVFHTWGCHISTEGRSSNGLSSFSHPGKHIYGVFEECALDSADMKPSLWLTYVDNTFVMWPHGEGSLDTLLGHLNNIHPSIELTMDKESGGCLPFLDVLVSRDQEQGRVVTTVNRKLTHTKRYLHFKSYCPPHVKTGIIRTLVHRSKVISHHLQSHSREVKHLINVSDVMATHLASLEEPCTAIKKRCGRTKSHNFHPLCKRSE